MAIQAGGSAVTGVYLGDQLLTKGGEVTIKTFAEMAPGPSELKGGDWDCGYFGIPTTAEMGIITGTGTSADGQPITATNLATAFNVTEGTMINNYIIWHKFVFNGEIIYIAQKGIRCEISFNALARKNLVYGAQVLKTDLAKFRVALLKGIGRDIYDSPAIDGSKDNYELSEWDMLLRGLGTSPYKTDFGLRLSDADLDVDGDFSGGSSSWIQEPKYFRIESANPSTIYEHSQMVRGGTGGDYKRGWMASLRSIAIGWRPALRFTF